ncbi:MAG: hypothetical protein M3Y36_00880 [Actinomycetota bacterium]|nr:hypothetical protein [Actinomycetota bacterium]
MFRLAPEDGAVLVAALAAATDRGRAGRATTGPDETPGTGDDGDRDPTLDPPAAARADALIAIAGDYLDRPAGGDDPDEPGDTADRYVVNIITERSVLEDQGRSIPTACARSTTDRAWTPEPSDAWRARRPRCPSPRTNSAMFSTWADAPGGSAERCAGPWPVQEHGTSPAA